MDSIAKVFAVAFLTLLLVLACVGVGWVVEHAL